MKRPSALACLALALLALCAEAATDRLRINPDRTLSLQSQAGKFYLLCDSTDLDTWRIEKTIESTGESITHTPGGPAPACRFFRVLEFDLQPHVLRFFLDPNLAAGLSEEQLRARLTLYHQEIAAIFAKQTNRRLLFDPATGITLTATQPHSNSYSGTLPESGFEIWIHARLTDNPTYGTYGGYAGIDRSGAGVAAGLYWDAIHDPAGLVEGTPALEQYWRQIDHIVHELEHVWGAGYGEYYNLSTVNDTTGVAPTLNIRYSTWASDPFWGLHQDYLADPLRTNIWNQALVGSPTSLAALRSTVAFADVTVAVVCGGVRSNGRMMTETLPNLSAVQVEVRDRATKALIPGATLRAFTVRCASGNLATEITVTPEAGSGRFTFPFTPYPNSVFNNFDQLKLLKAAAAGYAPGGRYICTFDAMHTRLLGGKMVLVVPVYLDAS